MLNERRSLILKYIVDMYVKKAEPVSSSSIAKLQDMKFSSATIRNEMAFLEEQGFIEKTHTSSGRVPSSKGYRYYVDNILIIEEVVSENTLEKLDVIFDGTMSGRDEVIKQSLNYLSELTNYTSIVLGPNAFKSTVKKIQFVPLNNTIAIIILVTDKGHVESKQFDIPNEVDIAEVEKVIRVLNDLLQGITVSDIPQKIDREFRNNLKSFMNYHEVIIDSFLKAFSNFVAEKYYLSGQANILNQPEFHDINKLRDLIGVIEQKEILKLIPTDENQLKIKIGQENEISAMKDCTLISVPYEIDVENKGAIALLGPTRMDYSQILPLLNYLAKRIETLYK